MKFIRFREHLESCTSIRSCFLPRRKSNLHYCRPGEPRRSYTIHHFKFHPKPTLNPNRLAQHLQTSAFHRRYVITRAPHLHGLARQPRLPLKSQQRQAGTEHRSPATASLFVSVQRLARPDCQHSRGFACAIAAFWKASFSHDMIRTAVLRTAPRGGCRAFGRGYMHHHHLHHGASSYNTFAEIHCATPILRIPTTRRLEYTARAAYATMASATSFFDFKPADSTSFHLSRTLHADHTTASSAPYLPSSYASCSRSKLTPSPPHRARQTLPAQRPLQQSRPCSKHRLKVRLHATIRGLGSSLQRPESHVPQRFRNHRVPVQPVRRARPRFQRRDPRILPSQLRREFPCAGQD